MVTVFTVRPHHAGFGMFDCDCEGVQVEGCDTVRDYTDYVVGENCRLSLVHEEDEDYEKVADADGRIYNQSGGVLVGWRDRQTGDISMELVCED